MFGTTAKLKGLWIRWELCDSVNFLILLVKSFYRKMSVQSKYTTAVLSSVVANKPLVSMSTWNVASMTH